MLKIAEDVLICEGARIVGDVTIGPESGVWFNAVIRGDDNPITIGSRTNIQDNVVIHAGPKDAVVIGDGVTIGHAAIIHACTIGDNSLVGMGATVMDHTVVGKNCIIGAGALVTANQVIPDGSLVLGAPAKVKRALTEEEIETNRISADVYVNDRLKYMK